MKKIKGILLTYFYMTPMLALANFQVSDPKDGLFDKTTKIVQGFNSAQWIINMGAGLFAITCFISAGNYARQGTVGRAAGAAIGGVIAVLGAYFVGIVGK